MTNDKGLIETYFEGISDGYETEGDLTVLGGFVYASYQNNRTWGHVEDGEFGAFKSNSLRFILDVYIDHENFDTDLQEELSNYESRNIDHLDYDYHANNDIWQVRALVAMNGACLEKLSKDPDARVRQKVVEYVLDQHENGDGFCGIVDFACKTDEQESLMFKRFVPISVNLGDISYIDNMIDDEDEGVRYSIARMGITRHIDALINDESAYVKMAIAYKGQERHLEHLLNDESPDVLRLIVSNQNATLPQLQTIAHREKHPSVLEALMQRGVYHEFFIDGPIDSRLKIFAAIKGYSHDRLSRDEYSFTREVVAEYTRDMDILNRLLEDEDSDVAFAARLRVDQLKT